MNEVHGKIALVTGSSRGVGSSVACMLAARGADIAVNYHSKAARAEAVAIDIRAMGRTALLVQADITKPGDVAGMMEAIRRVFGRLDILVLNASGGLERGKPADYAMQLNCDAQVALVDAALPLMAKGGRIVFVTSHMAHFHGTRNEAEGPYAPVAASKHAGEQALRSRAGDFATRGIEFVVVSGPMIEGTITAKLLRKMSKGAMSASMTQAGEQPMLETFAQAVADAASGVAVGEGTVFVGSVEPVMPEDVWLLAGQSNMIGFGPKGSELPDDLKRPLPGVLMYGGEAWRALQPGDGMFGPEIGFGHEMAKAMPGARLLLVKAGFGLGNLYDDWRSPNAGRGQEGPHYGAFIKLVTDALSTRPGAKLAGMLWMQGEGDAHNDPVKADSYEQNLALFIASLRRDLKAPSLGFVIGKISASPVWVYADKVREAQSRVCEAVPRTAIFDATDLPFCGDDMHYSTMGAVELGRRFARAARSLRKD